MSREDLTATPTSEELTISKAVVPARVSPRAILTYSAALLVCTLISLAPLGRLEGTFFLPTNPLLLWWCGWLPSNLPLAPSYKASVQTTGVLEFLGFVPLAFGIYAAGALYIFLTASAGIFTLMHELRRQNQAASLCIDGGQGIATISENAR